jgi:hypothetical protein
MLLRGELVPVFGGFAQNKRKIRSTFVIQYGAKNEFFENLGLIIL